MNYAALLRRVRCPGQAGGGIGASNHGPFGKNILMVRTGRGVTAVGAAVIACLAAAGVSGCTQSEETCVVQDYGGGTGGYQTPRQALASVLAEHDPRLPQTGWKVSGRGAAAVSFVAGKDSVDVVQNKAGQWNVGGVTACAVT